MKPEQKQELLEDLDRYPGRRKKLLLHLALPRPTYYRWRRRYEEKGLAGLGDGRVIRTGSWNEILPSERVRIIQIAKDYPQLSPRLLAIKITDEEEFSVSETKVYLILKQEGLIQPQPIADLPAAKEWSQKTTKVDEIWQCDATHYFVVSYGFYKQITVLDDYSRNAIAWDLKADETAFSISDVIERALENAQKLGPLAAETRPKLLSDNGPGFVADMLAKYLTQHGIKHIFGKPYHPQTQGKIERFHRRIKDKVCLLVYCGPEELRQSIGQAITQYNVTPHKALDNVSPQDVYAGRKEEILRKRVAKKELTMLRRKLYNLSKKKMVSSTP